MITHHEITAGLWLLVFASGGIAGRFAYWRSLRRKLDDEYERGWDRCVRAVYGRAENGEVLRLSPDGRAAWCDAGSQWDRDGANAPTGFDEEGVMPDDSERDETRSVEPGPVETVRPAGPSPAAGRTIYPELAELARHDAESDSQALAVPASVDPHWYANGLHWLADWQADWHEDAARFDAWLPGYLDWYRRSLEPKWALAGRMLEGL